MKLIAFRLKYFTHKFEVFDGCIVVLSYALDLASLYVNHNHSLSPFSTNSEKSGCLSLLNASSIRRVDKPHEARQPQTLRRAYELLVVCY